MQPAAKDGFHIALLGRGAARLFHILHHARITLKIFVHIILRFAARNTELLRQSKGAHTVNQPKVYRFRAAALLATDLLNRGAHDLSSRSGVNIFPLLKGIHERLIAR